MNSLDEKAIEAGVYSFRDLQSLGFVRDRTDLHRKQKHYNFPRALKLGARQAVFLRQEVHGWVRLRDQSRERLEAILGPATIVVRSGGQWLDPQSGERANKLHLHFRLAETATGAKALAQLKRARDLAARIVGADPSGKS